MLLHSARFFQRAKKPQTQFLPELCKLLVSLIDWIRQVSPGKVYTSSFGQLGTGMTLINFYYWSRDMLSFLRWTFLSSSFYERQLPEQRQRNYDKLIVPMLIDNSIGLKSKAQQNKGPQRVSRICFCDNENYVFSKLYAYPPYTFN